MLPLPLISRTHLPEESLTSFSSVLPLWWSVLWLTVSPCKGHLGHFPAEHVLISPLRSKCFFSFMFLRTWGTTWYAVCVGWMRAGSEKPCIFILFYSFILLMERSREEPCFPKILWTWWLCVKQHAELMNQLILEWTVKWEKKLVPWAFLVGLNSCISLGPQTLKKENEWSRDYFGAWEGGLWNFWEPWNHHHTPCVQVSLCDDPESLKDFWEITEATLVK